jgi:hypothetical protein
MEVGRVRNGLGFCQCRPRTSGLLYDVELGTAPVGLIPNLDGPYRRYGPAAEKGPNGSRTPTDCRKGAK